MVSILYISLLICTTSGFVAPPVGPRTIAPLSATAAPGDWEDCAGCRILRPPDGIPPRAVIHFLGGAFVSPQPTVAYRHVLESLSRRGYAVVTTPFAVDFDYRKPASEIRKNFAGAKRVINGCEDLKDVPLVSMGHSLGALMHVLLACLYPDDFVKDVAGVALVSYNNKPVEGAIPLFKELFVPAMAPLSGVLQEQGYKDALNTGQEIRRNIFGGMRGAANSIKDAFNLGPDGSFIPGVDPIFLKALDDVEAAAGLIDQIPDVLASISRGASEFEPSPSEMRSLVASSYSQRSPLVLSFADDGIDESDVLSSILPPDLEAVRKTLPGTHVTPLAIDPDAKTTPLLPIPGSLDDAFSIRSALLSDANALVNAVDVYFTSVISAVKPPAGKDEATKRSDAEISSSV